MAGVARRIWALPKAAFGMGITGFARVCGLGTDLGAAHHLYGRGRGDANERFIQERGQTIAHVRPDPRNSIGSHGKIHTITLP